MLGLPRLDGADLPPPGSIEPSRSLEIVPSVEKQRRTVGIGPGRPGQQQALPLRLRHRLDVVAPGSEHPEARSFRRPSALPEIDQVAPYPGPDDPRFELLLGQVERVSLVGKLPQLDVEHRGSVAASYPAVAAASASSSSATPRRSESRCP